MVKLYNKVEFTNEIETPLQKSIYAKLEANNFRGYLSASQAQALIQEFNLTKQELYFALLPFATCYAFPTVSNFFVGAIVECTAGNYYFGANMELDGLDIQFTVHAEQSAINHAYLSGAKGIRAIIVNYSPCGHCRQFINEINTANELKIFLPQIPDGQPLSFYLPESFGPNDLNVSERLFDNNDNISVYRNSNLTHVKQLEAEKGNRCYTPYSHSQALVVLETENADFFVGRYIENAAFNPSFAPLISALALARLYNIAGKTFKEITLLEDRKTTYLSREFCQRFGKVYNINFSRENL